MGRKKRGKAVIQARKNQGPHQEEEYKKAPHTFVINRGKVGKNVGDLVMDIRRVMEPYTATKLKTQKRNVLKDFIHMAGPLNVTHLILLSKTEKLVNLRLVRLPHGPTLTFRVQNYSLCRDVISSIRKAHMEAGQFNHHPLLVMNGFTGEGMQLKLMTTMFQNMFPSLNINKLKLTAVKRCVLVNYSADTKTVEFRHYNISAVPVGISKGLKKLMKPAVPSMARYSDISEYFMRSGNLSESEAEPDDPQNEVVLPQKMYGKGNIKSHKSAIRLTEIGPRLTLELVKIEEGICNGEVLYHGFITKTDEELTALRKRREEKKQLKQQRKKQQEEYVKKKTEKKEMLKQKCLAGVKEVEDPGGEADAESDTDDDTKYFKEEVGKSPDPDLLIARRKNSIRGKRKLHNTAKEQELSPAKKRKLEKLAEVKRRTKEFEKNLLAKKKKLQKKKEKKIILKSGRGSMRSSLKGKVKGERDKSKQGRDQDKHGDKGVNQGSKVKKTKLGGKMPGFKTNKGSKGRTGKR